MQTNSQTSPESLPFNPDVARRSLLKLGLVTLAGAWLPKTALAMDATAPRDVPDFLRHIEGHDPRRRYLNPICGT